MATRVIKESRIQELLARDWTAADHLIGMKFGMGTLDDMNNLKKKRIRSVAGLLQDQFGLALVRLENMVRGTICGAIRHKLIDTDSSEFGNFNSINNYL